MLILHSLHSEILENVIQNNALNFNNQPEKFNLSLLNLATAYCYCNPTLENVSIKNVGITL